MAATEIIVPLTDEEISSLAALEIIVDQGLDAFLAVGQALAEIQERRLWRPAKSFQMYLSTRYPEMCRSRAYQAIRHAKVYENLSTFVDVSSLKESHTRALAGFAQHLHAEIMTKAKELATEKGGTGDISAPTINRAGGMVLDAKNRKPSLEMEWGREEEEAETNAPATVPRAAALADAAERTVVPRVHPAIRAAEHHRLGRKDSSKIVRDDLRDPAIRNVVEKMVIALVVELGRLQEFVTD